MKEDMETGMVVYDKHIAFWGSAFSNFYPCKIKEGGVTYKSSEQYFMAKKAEFFGDEETLEKILSAKTPAAAKKLGREVKNFNDSWDGVREKYMFDAVLAKFSQNEDLRDFILKDKFNGKSFVEGSPMDRIWGVGVHYINPSIDDENHWNGQNLLGKTLDKVREILINEKRG